MASHRPRATVRNSALLELRDDHGLVGKSRNEFQLNTERANDALKWSDRRVDAMLELRDTSWRRLAKQLSETGVGWAATGLSAAWAYTEFADFRLNSFFVDIQPGKPEEWGLRAVDEGANVWLAVPADVGVFHGTEVREVPCVHPVQVYLDLLSHPERASEAAQNLRQHISRGWRP